MVGIYAQAEENIVYVHDPELPKWLGEVTLSQPQGGSHHACACASAARAARPRFSVLDKQGPGRIVVVE